jgi:hypothetical protein
MTRNHLPTIKWHDDRSEAHIIIPYEVMQVYTEDVVKMLLDELVNDFITDVGTKDEQLYQSN